MSDAMADSELFPILDKPNRAALGLELKFRAQMQKSHANQGRPRGISAEFKRNQRKYENYVFKLDFDDCEKHKLH